MIDLDTRCAIMDLPVATCAHCLKLPDPDIVRAVAERTGSLCRGCGEPILIGESIWRPQSQSRGWYGECCD